MSNEIEFAPHEVEAKTCTKVNRVAVPPGATLQETIDSLGMTQRELALRTGMAPKTINEIINGKAPITPATSVLLERVTGIPARMWNNLESNYRERLARTADCDRLQRELDEARAQVAKGKP